MTRYSRARGSKACNLRQTCTATPWNSLKNQVVSENNARKHVAETIKSNEKGIAIFIDSDAAWYDFITNSDLKGKDLDKISKKYNFQRKRNDNRKGRPKESQKGEGSSKISGEGKDIVISEGSNDAKKIRHTRIQKSKLGNESAHTSRQKEMETMEKSSFSTNGHLRPSDNLSVEKSSIREVSLTESLRDSRRLAKAIKREKKKVCFCCRRWGHQLADCPDVGSEIKRDVVIPSGCFCYNCGSTEHKMSHCNKTGRKTFKFANCFVCGEEGHLARLCPDNPKGSYPKGGSCLTCGEVDHLQVDCPRVDKSFRETESSLTFMTSGPVESLPEDLHTSCASVKSKRIVQF